MNSLNTNQNQHLPSDAQASLESQRQLSTLMANLPGMVYRCENKPDWPMTFVSEGCLPLTGYSSAELMENRPTYGSLILGRDQQCIWDGVQEAVTNHQPFEFTYQIVTANKTLRWVWERGCGVFADDGTMLFLEGFITDVTEQRQAVDALLAGESRFHELFEHSPDAIFVEDASGVVLDVNPAACQLHGADRENLVGKNVLDLVPPEIREKVRLELSGWISGKFSQAESISLASDGRLVPVEIRSSPIRYGGRPAMLLHVRDITERKLAEQALIQSQKNLAEAQQQTHIGSFELNYGTGRLDWSDELLRIYGIQPEDFQGRTEDFWNRVHPEDLQRIWELREEGLSKPGPLKAEFRIVRPDGEIRFVRMVFETTFNGKGEPLRRLGTLQDITEVKNAEQENNRLSVQLQHAQKMESVGRLAGGVAHDFNNMLEVILGHAELALEQALPSEPIYDSLMEIQKAAQRSADLTRQLLAFARKQTITPQVLILNERLSAMMKMLQRLIGEDIKLEWKPAQDLWPVQIDPAQIDQIMTNLAVNARDAITGVGVLTIETANVILGEEYCHLHEGSIPGDYVLLAVSDTGTGMDDEILHHIFEPFFTTKDTGKGTGLGLATVYGIVKQNKGYLEVQSKCGIGSRFFIYLPRTSEEATKASVHRTALRKAEKTVLLVEDEPSVIALTMRLLQDLGYGVLTAASPDEAIRHAREHTGPIDILLSDVVMPNMNGRDLANTLVSLRPELQCVFMSGWTAEIIEHQGIMEPGTYFLQKPFSKQQLSQILHQVKG